MANSLIIVYRGIYLLVAIFSFGCFSLTNPNKTDSILPIEPNNSSILDTLANQNTYLVQIS